MKITKGKIILLIVVLIATISAYKSLDAEKKIMKNY